MCNYCTRVQSAIQKTRTNGFWMGRCRLLLDHHGDIRYTKWSSKTMKPYTKTIPLSSLCAANALFQTQGLAAVNRSWHNSLAEGKNRPCNLKVIENILACFK